MSEPAGLHRPHRGVSAADRQGLRRAQLLETALEAFGTRGVSGVTIEEICRAARLNKRYFYESFASLDALLDAVVEQTLQTIFAGLAPLVASGGVREPRAAVTYFVRTVMTDERYGRLLFIEADSGALRHRGQGFVDLAVDMWMASDSGIPADPAQRALVRTGAYAYAGACREVILASILGRIDHSPDELADYLTRLLELLPTLLPADEPGPS